MILGIQEDFTSTIYGHLGLPHSLISARSKSDRDFWLRGLLGGSGRWTMTGWCARPGQQPHNYRKSPCLMGKSWKIHHFDWAIFNSYVTNYQRLFLKKSVLLFIWRNTASAPETSRDLERRVVPFRPLIWVNFITTSLFDRTLEIIVRIREIIPFYGPTIQVSEIL